MKIKSKNRCKAKTDQGKRCKFPAVKDGYCTRHFCRELLNINIQKKQPTTYSQKNKATTVYEKRELMKTKGLYTTTTTNNYGKNKSDM